MTLTPSATDAIVNAAESCHAANGRAALPSSEAVEAGNQSM